MKSYLSALRAISSLYLRSMLKTIGLIVGLVFAALMGLIAYVAHEVSLWWWVFAVPVAFVFMVIGAVLLVLWLVSGRLLPRELDREERRKIMAFAEKVTRVADQTSTPYPLIMLHIAKDAVIHRDSRFLKELIEDSSSLRGDFVEIRKLFT